MKIKVDFDVCVSSAACRMQACPQVFESRDDGFPIPRRGTGRSTVRAVEEPCRPA